jgi:hypothetical protein
MLSLCPQKKVGAKVSVLKVWHHIMVSSLFRALKDNGTLNFYNVFSYYHKCGNKVKEVITQHGHHAMATQIIQAEKHIK